MDEILLGSICGILAANMAFLIAYLTKISSGFEEHNEQRRVSLDKNFISEINEVKSADNIVIDSFLPLFKEYVKIENLKNQIVQIYQYFFYSIAFTFFALVLGLLDISELAGVTGVPIEVLATIGGGFLLLWTILTIINYKVNIHKWKEGKKRPNKTT